MCVQVALGTVVFLMVQVAAFHQIPKRRCSSTFAAARLTFNCDSIHESEPIPSVLKPDQVMEFFQHPQQRNCAISCGSQNNFQEVETTDELFQEWRDRCKVLGGREPDRETDIICKVEAGETKLLGIKLVTNVFVGAKLVEDEGNGYPWYEFTLINDEQHAKGFGPAVRIFKKIMATQSNSCVSSLSRLTAAPSGDGQTVFKFLSEFRIIVQLPSIFLKLLPVQKERVEREGSKTIGKTLKKQTQSVLHTLRKNYIECEATTPLPLEKKRPKFSKLLLRFQ
mmetsp:Transcript_19451/g.28827  ORF Transcript_19451/g.28827 Transcript_19451/m.28827 type:complete len:281 (-) Transcript_19451:1079-1921(-)